MNNSLPTSSSNDRRLPMLYPTPGKLHGSRKRRAFSNHGPHSVSNCFHSPTGRPIRNTKDLFASESPPRETESHTDTRNCSSPQTPLSTHNEFSETVCSTPKPVHSMSSPMNDISLFQHLSLRSPGGKLTMSPSSSFSHYARSEKSISGVTATTGDCSDSGELTFTATSNCSASNKSIQPKVAPLTIVSGSPFMQVEDSKAFNNGFGAEDSTEESKLFLLSPRKVLTPRSSRRSKFMPSPKSTFLPSPRRSGYSVDVGRSSGINQKHPVVVTEEKRTPINKPPFHTTNISPMMSLSPIDASRGSKRSNVVSVTSVASPSPPIPFISLHDNESKAEKKAKRKTSTDTGSSWSLFKPAPTLSNGGLSEMMYSLDGDTDGSLSDSDDEADGFFLGGPSCLAPPSLSCTESDKDNQDGLSLAAAYSFRSKKTKFQGSTNVCNSSKTNFSGEPQKKQSVSQSAFSSDEKKGVTSASNNSLFGMNIIHENSVSHSSLFEMGTTCFVPKRNSSRNLDGLGRSKSDLSISSLGLSIEDSTSGSSNEVCGRDMVTPPVNCRTMLSPPPLKSRQR